MTEMSARYHINLFWSAEDECWIADVPDLRFCSAFGDSPETAVREVKVAMQEENGTWRTFPIKALGARESMTAYACKGTGKYMYWVRRVNDTEILLPSDQEILTEYRSR